MERGAHRASEGLDSIAIKAFKLHHGVHVIKVEECEATIVSQSI